MEPFVDPVTPTFEDYKQDNQKYWRAFKNPDRDAFASWAQMYYPNAYQAAMLNYQNEWQSPKNQMLRYQEAGLNPYSFQAQSSASGAQGSKPEPVFGNQELGQQKISNALKGATTVSQVLSVAKDIFDYIRYGKERSFHQTGLIRAQEAAAKSLAESKEAQAIWDQYWNLGESNANWNGDSINMSKTPRGMYMASSTGRINAQIAQLEYITKFLYPSQKDLNEARKALTEYQKEIAQGRYDAVLNINTGNQTADTILRMISMWLLQTSLSLRP